MTQTPVTIPKQPALKPAEDFYRLRREGIELLEQMSSRQWTDYNLHDPGITLLEALAYAITDLAYRTGWDIQDLLTAAQGKTTPNQGFYTARKILTVNPWTTDDFRRLLIDLDMVRNAWVFCKKCACDHAYYAWCDENKVLQLSFEKPQPSNSSLQKVTPIGIYEALLELEADPAFGDMNDRKIEQTVYAYDEDGNAHPLTIELRFPDWEILDQKQLTDFITQTEAGGVKQFARKITSIQPYRFSRSNASDQKTSDPFDKEVKDNEMRRFWREVFYVSFKITFSAGPDLRIENAAMRFFGGETVKKALSVVAPAPTMGFDLQSLLKTMAADEATPMGFIQKYRRKLRKIADSVEAAKKTLHQHRNLDEDFCRIRRVDVEDVAVCADVEVAPDADLEKVQAAIWFTIERYFNPPVPFYTLAELAEEGVPMEDIFNGPALESGFLKAEELQASGLKSELRVSDILNLLMDIEGIKAVNNLLLTKYDGEGRPVRGAADRHSQDGDKNKINASWTLALTPLHQPRLYFNLSRFLFYKNGLPFQARADEAMSTLTQLRGAADRPKVPNAPKDLPVPVGAFRDPAAYYPTQYNLPRTYGVSLEGLSSSASVLRRAQAQQLRGYLMPFEQILTNANAQVGNIAELFSIESGTIRQTYFAQLIKDDLLNGAGNLISGLTDQGFQQLVETETEYKERRNRFLNHLLARFGEQFAEYALLLTARLTNAEAQEELITDKLAFLRIADKISHDRGKAFNYQDMPTALSNVPGLRLRLGALLGIAPGNVAERFILVEHLLLRPKFLGDALYPACADGGCTTCGGAEDPYSFKLTYVMTGWVKPFDTDLEMRRFADQTIRQETPAHLLPKICWVGNDGLADAPDEPIFLTVYGLLKADVAAADLGSCASMVLEKHQNDYEAFVAGNANLSQTLDEWRNKLKTEKFSLITKADFPCLNSVGDATWASLQNVLLDYFIKVATTSLPCEPVPEKVLDLLVADHNTTITSQEACYYGEVILYEHGKAFRAFFEPKKTEHLLRNGWESLLKQVFNAIKLADFPFISGIETATWTAIQNTLLTHFTDIAYFGWQFERFEAAWKQWLETNNGFDWPEERLQERIEAILADGIAPKTTPLPADIACQWATQALTAYGIDFQQKIKGYLEEGRVFDTNTWIIANPNGLVPTLPTGFIFKTGTDSPRPKIVALLKDRYEAYKEVSYRLWIVLDLLSKLRNVYPGATLHDCDDGSDEVPVRLGATALGSARHVSQPILSVNQLKLSVLESVAPLKKKTTKKTTTPSGKTPKNTKGKQNKG